MDEKVTSPNREPAPDQRKLTTRQAQRVAELSGIQARELQDVSIADAADRLKWRIDPDIFLFRRVCGKVVKRNTATGVDEPVPFATVHVEDTDCSFLGFFPVESPFWWLFPLSCRREVIATTRTDRCGRFCVWIPRFDIDWLLRFRRYRLCFLDLFKKPTLGEVLERFKVEDVEHQRIMHVNPNPPDPSPETMLADNRVIRRVEDTLGRQVAQRLTRIRPEANLGEQTEDLNSTLEQPAFAQQIAPPRPNSLREVHNAEGIKGMAKMLGLTGRRAELLSQLRFEKAIGPFWRCRDIYYLEYVPFFDVPDITFRVTQDVDGDGDEETVYSEGYFDVRWNAGAIPDVTLHANSSAISVPSCDQPPNIGPCATPGLVSVGDMPLINPSGTGTFPYVSSVNGYAVRPNRPHASGRADEVVDPTTVDATSPLTYLLNFWGCNHKTSSGATVFFYKVLRETSTDEGVTWTSPVPVFDSWTLVRSVGSPPRPETRTITADIDGWYPVVNPIGTPPEGWLPSDSLILQWHPGNTPDGFHRLKLLLGDAAKSPLETSPPVLIRIDDSGVNATFFRMRWRKLPSGDWENLTFNCPVIRRERQSIEVELTVHVTAQHLRSVSIGASGCGPGTTPVLVRGFEPYQTPLAPPGVHRDTYWHKSRTDNNFSNDANPVIYRIDSSFAPGAYTFGMTAYSRAFYPGAGHLWLPDQSDVTYNPVWNGASPSIAIAIVD